MPRGRPRKIVEPEVLPPEESDDQPKQGKKRLVEAEHTIKYSAPVPVTVEETNEEGELLDFDLEEEEKPKRKKINERDELRKTLAKNNITPASQLRLTIERYLHSESSDGGTWAETEHCTKYPCTKDHITSEDYLDVARKWGVGTYRFTLRMQHQIVTAWDKRIGAASGSPSPVGQQINSGDPTQPQVVVQMPEGSQQQIQPMTLTDLAKYEERIFERKIREMEMFRKVMGLGDQSHQVQPAPDPDAIWVQSLLSDNTKLKEKISNGLIGQILGSKAVDDDPSMGAVAMEAIKSGQAEKIVQAALAGLGNILERLLPKRETGNQNGQTQMATPPLQTRPGFDSSGQEHGQDDNPQEIPQGHQSLQPANGEIDREGGMLQQSPEDQALALVIDHCAKKLPPEIAFQRLIAYADAINDQAPQYSIDGYLDLFARMPVDSALEFVKTLPNGAAVVELEHTKVWTEQLQKLIKESGGDEDA